MPDRPNILLIMSDQLIPMMTGAYGHPVALTPNINRLARRGVTFTNAYTSCPICAPARMSLLTGRYVSDIGCNDNTSILASDEPTFNHYLSIAGYDTVLAGKMHMVGPDQLHGYAQRLNTDVYPADFTWLCSRAELSEHSAIHEKPIAIDYVGANAGVRQWSMQLAYDEETHYRALEYLRSKGTKPAGTAQKPLPERDDRPFCLHVSYQHPHEPFLCMQLYWDLYDGVDIPIPSYPDDLDGTYTSMDRSLNTFHGCSEVDLRDPDSLRTVYRAYLANVSYVDDKIGELLTTLEESGLADDTVILFCSDHGDMLGQRGMVQKRTFYEYSSRIVMIASAPADVLAITPGSVCADPVSIVDVAPTVLDLAGVADWLPMGGRSLMPQILGETEPERTVFCENHVEGVTGCCFMVRQGRYKLNHIHGAETQLFDLEEDPDEWRDLAGRADMRDVEQQLRGLILRRFGPDEIDRRIVESLRKRQVIKEAAEATGGLHWDYQPFFDAGKQYWREG